MKRYDLTNAEYEAIRDLVEYKPSRGPTPENTREMLNAIFYILCSGTPWRCLPDGFPAWPSVYSRFRALVKKNVFDQIMERLLRDASQSRQIVLSAISVDGSYIRAHRHAAGAPKKTGRMRRSGVRAAASRPRST